MASDSISITVEGMSCSHCEHNIKTVVGALNGVNSVLVDLNTKRVLVEFDSEKVSIETIKGTIEDQGYDVK